MSRDDHDLIVIGSGAAGSSAASAAARPGRRVAMIERDKVGGSCLNYGCDPTKALLHAARVLAQARQASGLGLVIPEARADWPRVQAHVREVQAAIRGGTEDQARVGLADTGVELIAGEARFRSPHEIEVNGKLLRSERFVIATGTAPFVPDIDGLSEVHYLTNVEAVALPALPRSLAILGGGPIGLEFAQLFRRFGVQVTVVERGGQLLPREDEELAAELCARLSAEGIRLRLCTELRCSQVEGRGIRLQLQGDAADGEDLLVDQLLVAVGRRPALGALDLAAAGVIQTDKGIPTDATLRTNVAHIWAAGDITSPYQLTHVAADQGTLVGHNAFAKAPRVFDDSVVPWVTFTDPELARVGRTESDLRAAGVPYRVGRVEFNKIDRAIATDETYGSVKLLADSEGLILGGHILGAQAGELIALVTLAMRSGLSVSQLGETMLPYPTMAEAVRWAAQQL